MSSQVLLSELESRGFNVHGNSAMGVVNGYGVYIKRASFALTVGISSYSGEVKTIRKRLKSIDGVTSANYMNSGSQTPNMYQLGVKTGGNAAQTADNCVSVVDSATKLLAGAGVAPMERCPYCGAGGCDSYVLSSGVYRLAHRKCVVAAIGAASEKAERNSREGSYLFGILGAVLGVLVSCLPSVLTVLLMNTVYALLMIFVPLGIYYGYKLCGGKMDKAVTVVTVVFSALSVIVMDFSVIIISLMRSYGATLEYALRWLVSNLSDPSVWTTILIDQWQIFLFVAAGVWASWRYISRTAEADVRDSENALQTLSDNPDAVLFR